MFESLTISYRIGTNQEGVLSLIQECLEHNSEIVVPITDLPKIHRNVLMKIYEVCLDWELYEYLHYVIKEMNQRKIIIHL